MRGFTQICLTPDTESTYCLASVRTDHTALASPEPCHARHHIPRAAWGSPSQAKPGSSAGVKRTVGWLGKPLRLKANGHFPYAICKDTLTAQQFGHIGFILL